MSQENLCKTEVADLKEIFLPEVWKAEIQEDTVVWVRTIAEACSITSVILAVEDKKKNVQMLFLYNQLDQGATLAEVQKAFPVGKEFGVKQPYKKLSLNGYVSLRNDHPENLIMQNWTKSVAELKQEGNDLFKNNQNLQAVYSYRNAVLELEKHKFVDKTIKIAILSNMA